jgi:tRNA/rRNA methyltransferase
MSDEMPKETAAAPCVILNVPQLAENIGAVARVMANFGLSDLRLVTPRDGWPQERAWASASGANWPLDEAKVFATLPEAVADLQLVYATTARPRELQLPVLTPREAAGKLSSATASGLNAGLLRRRPASTPACCSAANGPGWRRPTSPFVRRW